MEAVIGLSLIVAFIVGMMCYEAPYVPKYVKPKPKAKPKQKPKSKSKPKVVVDPAVKAAKATLVTFGYSATEAKDMLKGIKAQTEEEYVAEALKRVKI